MRHHYRVLNSKNWSKWWNKLTLQKRWLLKVPFKFFMTAYQRDCTHVFWYPAFHWVYCGEGECGSLFLFLIFSTQMGTVQYCWGQDNGQSTHYLIKKKISTPSYSSSLFIQLVLFQMQLWVRWFNRVHIYYHNFYKI